MVDVSTAKSDVCMAVSCAVVSAFTAAEVKPAACSVVSATICAVVMPAIALVFKFDNALVVKDTNCVVVNPRTCVLVNRSLESKTAKSAVSIAPNCKALNAFTLVLLKAFACDVVKDTICAVDSAAVSLEVKFETWLVLKPAT